MVRDNHCCGLFGAWLSELSLLLFEEWAESVTMCTCSDCVHVITLEAIVGALSLSLSAHTTWWQQYHINLSSARTEEWDKFSKNCVNVSPHKFSLTLLFFLISAERISKAKPKHMYKQCINKIYYPSNKKRQWVGLMSNNSKMEMLSDWSPGSAVKWWQNNPWSKYYSTTGRNFS